MIEDDEGPEPLARALPDVEETVDHAEPVALLVAEAGTEQFAGLPVDGGLAILDHIAAHRGLLDHVGEVALVHLDHPAAGMARSQIAAEQSILLLGRPRLARRDFDIRVAAEQFALGRAGLELVGANADRNARRTIDARRAIRDRLRAAEPDPPERFIELARVAPR